MEILKRMYYITEKRNDAMLCLKARAKINWTLDILGRRADGYHQMDMLMQSVRLADTLWLEESDRLTLEDAGQGFRTETGDGEACAAPVPFDENNLVVKAARALQKAAGIQKGARMRLRKEIPSGAGMGGGSADAAAALIGLNRLWKLGFSTEELERIGLTVGADVPFLVRGGLCRAEGIGEKLTSLTPAPQGWLVLWQPCGGLSTGEIFSAFDHTPPEKLAHPQTLRAQQALLTGDWAALAASMKNVLEGVSVEKRPELNRALRRLEALGALRAMMTGSGSVVYGLFDSQEKAKAALVGLDNEKGFRAVTCTEAEGVRFIPPLS